MTYLLHVGTDLMGTARFQDALYQGGIAEALQDLIMGNCTLANTAIRVEDLHAETVLGITTDIALDASLILHDITPYQRIVTAMGCLVEELLAQCRLGSRSLGYHEQSARILIDAMDQTHFRVVGIKLRHIAQVPGHSLNQGAMEVSGSRMNHHSCLFVNHHQLVVFINHIDVDFFRLDACFMTRAVEHQRNDVVRAHLVIALHRFTVYMNKSGISCLLNAVAALVSHLISQILVYADRILVGIHLHLPVLIEVVASFASRSSSLSLHLEFIIKFIQISCIIKPEVILYRSIYLIIYII